MYKLFIVEDDIGIAEAIKVQAEMWDLQVHCTENFHNVMAEFSEFSPHIVLLDIALPFFNGYHWCSEIRKVSKVPIIFISSASDNMNMVMAMNMGADDFIAKPFDQSVLMAKLQALLRRTYDFASSVPIFEHRGDFYGTFGGIFFLGIILSVVFLIAAVLIIYYKQITEGYEDESRFAIIQKVGMTKKDIRKSVNSQMLTVFFMPLVMAVMHLAFAFPIVKKLLALFNLRNVPLMIAVLAVTILVFGVFYAVVYKITSNVYFSIVSENKSERS